MADLNNLAVTVAIVALLSSDEYEDEHQQDWVESARVLVATGLQIGEEVRSVAGWDVWHAPASNYVAFTQMRRDHEYWLFYEPQSYEPLLLVCVGWQAVHNLETFAGQISFYSVGFVKRMRYYLGCLLLTGRWPSNVSWRELTISEPTEGIVVRAQNNVLAPGNAIPFKELEFVVNRIASQL